MESDDTQMCDDKQIEYRLTQLEGEVKEINTDIKAIIRNHLPHLTAKIAALDLKTTKHISGLTARVTIIGGLIFGAISVLIGLFITNAI